MNFPACLLGPLFLLAAPARGAIALPDIFADHMVLQRDMPVPVWGTAAPGERITVAVGESQRSAVAVGGTPAVNWLSRRAEAEPEGLDPAGFAAALPDEREWSKHFSVILEPIATYAIRGVIWDQGESGTGIPGVKSDPMRRLLIRTWRRVWGQGDFPFLFFQYPKAGGWNPQLPLPRNLEPYRPHEWGLVSLEHAAQSLALPNVWMGITMDLETGTHPLDKQSYAGRLAKLALAKTYGKKVPHFGPTYESMRSEGDKIRVAFTHTDGGLVFHGGSKIQGFVVAGEDMKFLWADAEIDGDTVLVRHDGIAQPIHVRYAWAYHPKWCNLFNKAGFPALPFRSDR